MPRAAGDSTTYEFVLLNKSTGRFDRDQTIKLDSVTTIIKATLAAPQLVDWAYRTTRDNIAGLFSMIGHDPEAWDYVTDADMLEEALKDNQLRPVDIRDERGDEGHVEHAALERLCKVALEHGEEAGDDVAKSFLDSSSGHSRAIGGWWLTRKPDVVCAEKFLYSLKHRFAGTVDIIYRDEDKALVCCDLKTRKARDECTTKHGSEETKSRCLDCNPKAYASDHIQTGAYDIAYEEMEGGFADYRTVLMARADGTWTEEESTIDRTAFLDLKAVYDKMKGGPA